MPYDSGLAGRLTDVIEDQFLLGHPGLAPKKMFGGFGYMLNGNMCIGIHKSDLMLRVGVPASETLLLEDHVRPMDLTGRVMKGWLTVESEAIVEDSDLARFCKAAIDFVETLDPK